MRLPNPQYTADLGSSSPTATSAPESALIIVVVRNMIGFPGTVFPVILERERSIAAAQAAVREERPIGILLQQDVANKEPGPADLHRIGTVCNILRYLNAPDGTHQLVLQGAQRFQIKDYIQESPYFIADVLRIEEPDQQGPKVEATRLNLQRLALETLQLLPQAPAELVQAVQNTAFPGALADLVVAYLDVPPEQKQDILETVDPMARMEKVAGLLADRIEVLRITNEIGQQTRKAFDERQREAVLREQMASIEQQLGEGEGQGKSQEVAELSTKIDSAGMPAETEASVRRELSRYERSPETSPETGMLRAHLEWMFELPWRLPDDNPIDISEARKTLDADHFGLTKIKQRIIEYIAVRKLAPNGKAPILCFVGPPGVGKTSLGQSIARALGRPFGRISLGGVHDEAEIRGHPLDLHRSAPRQHHPRLAKSGRAQLRDDARRDRQDGSRCSG